MAKQKKPERVREVYAETYVKDSNPVAPALLASLLEVGKAHGYIQRAGQLSDGTGFAQVYIIIDADAGDIITEAREKFVEQTCATCGEAFEAPQVHGQAFCSSKCKRG